jgi:DNA-directed RNA polymerase subunit beta
LKKYWRTNQDTAVNQVHCLQGQKVTPAIGRRRRDRGGALALGQRDRGLHARYHNFEDGIVLSDLVKTTSIRRSTSKLSCTSATRSGQEEITREIPNVPEERCSTSTSAELLLART